MTTDKEYKFDEKLISNDIKFIDREIVNMSYHRIRCNRCQSLLKYINTLRIDIDYYSLGDDCYQSVKNILSEIRGKSLKFIKDDLEEGYIRHLENKWSIKTLGEKSDEIDKDRFDPEYSKFKILEWDVKHGSPPDFKKQEYQRLKQKFDKK